MGWFVNMIQEMDFIGLRQGIDIMGSVIKYNKDGWVCDRYPYNLKDYHGELEVSDEVFNETRYSEQYYAWRVVNGNLVKQKYEDKIWTTDERLQERIALHEKTDNDYQKYARQVRCNIDMPHSQQVLDYIDQYNLQVSDTINQPDFPQEVTYPIYQLP